MRDLAMRALDTATARGASYADVRFVRRRTQTVVVKNGRVEALTDSESFGFGVRVIVSGSWGFAASSQVTGPEVDRVAAQAVAIARASALAPGLPARLGPVVSHQATYRTPVLKDPFAVSLDEKISLLLRACEAMQAVEGIAVAEGSTEAWRESKTFANTEGAYIEQELIETGCSIEATAVGETDVQKRSFPSSMGRHQGAEGWEFVERWDLVGHAPRIAEEAVALLSADNCPSGETTIILDGSQLGLQIHESCGHATELDRVLGTEAAFAGTSFLTTDKLNGFRYGSDVVNLTADATIPGGLGTFGYDDEGVAAQRTELVRNGQFTGYLTDRESAARLGLAGSGGCARADGWGRIPLIRMTNVSLEPGNWTLADLIADTDDGIYLQTNKSWSIDDRRLNFQFGTEIAWEIKGGKLGRMLKNATYTGMTPQFWQSCDAIANRDHWTVWGTPNCGKGQPEQVAHTGHGASPARFRNIRVGVMH